jgi:hypothetical protein
MPSLPHRLLVALVIVNLAVVGCGGKSPASPSPAEPGNESPTPAPAAGSATIGGQVVSQASAMSAHMARAGLAGITVSVAGTSLSVVADGNGRFSLSNVPSGDQQLEFSGHGANARLTLEQIGAHETIDVTVAVTGGSAELVEEERVNGAEAQLEGQISAVNTGARTLVVRGVTVQVPTTATIRHGGTELTFDNLHVNDRVHVKGSKSGSIVTASEVNVQQGEDTPGGPGTIETAKGVISKLGGSCPDLTFSVGGKKVVVNASTEYLAGSSCGALANGATVEVEGPSQGSTLTALTVKIDDAGGAVEVTVKGKVSAMKGTCPSLTFKVQGKSITTSGGTEFLKGTCAQVVNGTQVEAEGVLSGNTIAAKKVQLEN